MPLPEDFEDRVEHLFSEASGLAPEERAGYLAEACNGDAALHRRVMELLASARRAADETFWETPALSHAAREPLVSELDRYRLLEAIGAGGMGVVHKAVRADDEYSKIVAVKIVLAPEADSVHRFRRERQLLAKLEHPNIARLLDGGTAKDGSPFLVMEYVDGVPIDRYVRERALDARATVRLFGRICEAVAYAHQNLIVHRDLKPANILVRADGEPKLLDFGIARLLDGAERSRTAPTAAMTLEYASPEQIRGGPITTATDIYALGVLLYELLTGRRPYATDGSPAAVTHAILAAEPAPMGRRVDSELENIVRMALRKEPERRYSSVGQLADDLRRYLEDYPVIAQPDSRVYRARKFVARNRAMTGAAVLVVLTLSGGIAATMWEARTAERRFRQVRNLANTYLLEIHDAIKDLPGSTAARRLVVRRALDYLDQLAAEHSGDVELARELATGYARIGDIQNQYAGTSLGELEAAVASHRKAAALLEPFERRNPRDLGVARDLAFSYGALNTLMMQRGDLAAAVSYGRKDAALMERVAAASPGDAAARQRLSLSYIRLGDVTGNPMMQNLGDTKGALAFYRKALANAEAAAAAQPGDWEKKGLVAIAHARLSQALAALADVPGEIAENRTSAAIEKELLAAHPQNIRLQWDAATASRNLSLSLLRGGQRQEARERAEDSLREYRALAAADPEHVNAQEQVANALALMGRIDAESGRSAEAFQLLREAIAALEGLRREHPGAPPDISERSADSLLAELALTAGSPAEALRSAARELAIDERLLKANPANAGAERNRAVALRQMGRARERLGDWRRALALHREGLAILQQMQAAGTLAPAYVPDRNEAAAAVARCERQLHAAP